MKIAYYIHHTTISAGGIFTYSIGILKEILKSSSIEKIIIITSNEVSKTLQEIKNSEKLEIRIVDRKKLVVKIRLILWYGLFFIIDLISILIPAKKLIDRIKSTISAVNPYKRALEDSLVDIFHVPVQYSPVYKINVPVVTTMHDLQEYHFPHYFSLKERLQRFINNRISIYDSEQIIVSFEHVKNDILSYFKINTEKVAVCPPPFAEEWFVQKRESRWKRIQDKYKIKKDYLLYPAATWKHKNHKVLLKAIRKIRDDGYDLELICTGNKTKYFQEVLNKVNELKLSQHVHFLGIVSENDLIGLFKNTALVVIPTLYEAGSGPLYEAMRYQVPVICSNVTSLPDTVSNDEFTFNPNDMDALSKLIIRGVYDNEFRKKNIENSVKRMEYFREIDYSDNFIQVYKKLISSRSK